MTEEEISGCFEALGKAFAERRALIPERDTLRRRLAAWGLVFTQLAQNPRHQDTLDELEAATDEGENPLEVWKAFQKAEQRLAELNMRIPVEIDHPFQSKPITDSIASRSPIPVDADH